MSPRRAVAATQDRLGDALTDAVLEGDQAQAGGPAHCNEVRLVGRLAAEPVPRELPSGDVIVLFRLVVDRPAATSDNRRRSPTVDTLDCAAWRKVVQRSLRSCQAGDVLEVQGALRRRFWRSVAGSASRTELEVASVRRLTPRTR